jgi:predicted ATPase
LMTAQWRAGRQHEALATFQRVRSVFAEELGLEPSPWLRSIEASIISQMAPVLSAPAGRSGPAARPSPVAGAARGSSRLVGREGVLAELGRSLRELPLITLVGPGGIGKTRLAEELLARHAGDFTDGGVFVDLASVTVVGSVVPTLAAALTVRPEPDRPLEDAVVAALRPRSLLLVIDNCEHVLDAVAPLLDRLWREAGSVRTLATSRSPFGIEGEQVWPVAPLEPRTEGVELFCARATAADVGFAASSTDRDAIADLCVQLDGLPLAIELAASRVRAFGVGQVAAQLLGSRALDVVAPGRRRSDRHQTLRHAIRWSYDLLAPSEREVLRSLSVFVGTFDLDGVSKVAQAGAAGSIVAADAVATLVDRSMLQRVESDRGPRYSMLETLRQFAEDELDAAGDTERLRRAHVRYYVEVVEAERRRAWSDEEDEAWRRLAVEWPNIRRAFESATDAADAALVGRLSAGLALYCLFSGNIEAGPWAARAVGTGFLAGHPAELAARGLWGIHAYWIAGDLPETGRAVGRWTPPTPVAGTGAFHLVAFMRAQALAERAEAARISCAWAELPGVAEPDWTVLAAAVRAYDELWLSGSPAEAAPWCDRALKLAEQLGSPTLVGYVLLCKAQIVGEAEPNRAIELVQRAGLALERLPVTGWTAIAPLVYLGAAHLLAGDQEKAVVTTIEALERSREQRFRQGARSALWAAAVCLARAGREEHALRIAGGSGDHAGRSSLGVAEELDRIFGDRWRSPLDDGTGKRPVDLLEAVDDALDGLVELRGGGPTCGRGSSC